MSNKRFYLVTRDLHLYLGLFLSPFLLLFAISTIFLVHSWIPGTPPPATTRTANDPLMPANLDLLGGRDQVNAIHGVLDRLGIYGEIGFVRRVAKEHRLIVPVAVPGRETTVDLNLETRSAAISQRVTGVADALIYLHKMPGPHNQNIRGNSSFLRIWRWLADGVVYLVLFISISGVYLWAVLRAERRIGLTILSAGAASFFGIIYALSR
jgi:hypothetical protein